MDIKSNSNNVHIQGVPKNTIKFQIEVTLEILGLKSHFEYFWKPKTCSYLSMIYAFKRHLASKSSQLDLDVQILQN